MLVITRHLNERIFIDGGTIKVTVVDVRGDKVRLGIEAPTGVPIHREEIHNAIARVYPESETEPTT